MIKKLTLLAFLAVLGTSAFAQISYGFYAGAASPMGDLGQTKTISGADDLDNIYNWCLFDADGKYGFANLGFNIGFDMSLQSSKIKGLPDRGIVIEIGHREGRLNRITALRDNI